MAIILHGPFVLLELIRFELLGMVGNLGDFATTEGSPAGEIQIRCKSLGNPDTIVILHSREKRVRGFGVGFPVAPDHLVVSEAQR
ncbi:MAG: hypothetical protein ACR2P9_00395, partial [Gammaproteobacteria bacterium]